MTTATETSAPELAALIVASPDVLGGKPRVRGHRIPVHRIAGWWQLGLSVEEIGEKHPATKPLKGFGSAGVLEVVEDYQSDTYRAVYTVRFKRGIYVLHCFKKKSTRGAQTTKLDMELIRARLKVAEQMEKET